MNSKLGERLKEKGKRIKSLGDYDWSNNRFRINILQESVCKSGIIRPKLLPLANQSLAC